MASEIKSFIRSIWFVLLALGPVACQWQGSQKPSVLVVAVEKLGFEKVSCDSDEIVLREFEGFKSLCDEGVRFTHAFTTSTLSQGAVASILTGLYPIEHQVRDNGANHLPARINTLAEMAIRSGYRTGFFSGGPPILRKSGLSQGFEVFDDHFHSRGPEYYRPAEEVLKTFSNWRERGIGGEPYFAVVYLSDLLFPNALTRSDQGEWRERTSDSQLKEVAESLSALVHKMKADKLWHRTHVIVSGVNGSGGGGHSSELEPMSLFAEDTQVAMFIKPARRSIDGGPQWTVDKNVSLADLGYSLYEFVGAPSPTPIIEELPRVSLFGLQNQALSDWDDDRDILIESAWGKWRQFSEIRISSRRRQYFYIHDSSPQLFNTLIDRMEVSPLPLQDPLWTSMSDTILKFFKSQNIEPYKVKVPLVYAATTENIQWWKTGEARFSLPTHQNNSWQAEALLEGNRWEELSKLGEEKKEPIYTFVAKKNLAQPAKLPNSYCGRFFDRKVWRSLNSQADIVEKCDDRLFKIALEAAFGEDVEQRERAFEVLSKRYLELSFERRVGVVNYMRDLIWDVSLGRPTGATYGDLFLSMPENRNLRDQISNRKLGEDSAFDL